MKKKKNRFRVLSKLDVEVLSFIWRWKLTNTMTLKIALAPGKSFWKFYQALRRLLADGYLKEVSDSGINISLWTLTKKGFSYVKGSTVGLNQERYQPQSLSHDYWATVFHLGDFIFGIPYNVEMISEQELSSSECLPDWVPNGKDHIPDGLTFIRTDKDKIILAFETEVTAKSSSRYEEMIRYLDSYEGIDWVFWLCIDDNLIEKISKQILSIPRKRNAKHNFIRMRDFQSVGWQSTIVWGGKAKSTIAEVMSQYGVNTPVNKGLIRGQPTAIEVFKSSIKSPKGLRI